MSKRLTKKSIKMWCGDHAYQKGERLCRAGKVRFIRYEANGDTYTAEISGPDQHEVSVIWDASGEIEAQCDCPPLGSLHLFCHHIAAVLMQIYETQQTEVPSYKVDQVNRGNPENNAELAIADRILGLFENKPALPIHNRTITETRTLLEAQFILKLLSLHPNTALFGIELRIGPKANYIVRNLAAFLDQIHRGEGCSFSPNFSYDPELHTFAQDNEAVLQALVDLVNDHEFYQETQRMNRVFASGIKHDRMLPIPPQAWKVLLPLLCKAPLVTVMDGERKTEGIRIAHDRLPLSFDFHATGSGNYEMMIQDLERIVVMEAYEIVFVEGTLYPLAAKLCERLAELKVILEDSGTSRIPIARGQIGSFIGKAVPAFKKLGHVTIDPSIAEHITQAPLQAKLYLDRVKDRLLAAVEFQYGDIVIDPLQDERGQLGANHIVLRDLEQERKIIELIEQNPFMKTEGGYVMSEEEAEFDFLYRTVPLLEKWMKIYATTAVKLRIHKVDTLPKIRVQVSAPERLNWLEFRLNMDWIPETEIRELVKSIEEKRKYYRLPSGSLLPLDSEELQELSEFLKETGLLYTDITGAKIEVPVTRGLPMLDQSYSIVKIDKPVRQLLENLRHPDSLDFPYPNELTGVLRDYQKLGYQWMKTLAYYGFGGILADDMGLGKTLQSIAFIASNLTDIRLKGMPALVISPGSLVYNWRNELRKFAPSIRVMIIDGTHHERANKLRKLDSVDIVITSYPLLLRDIKRYAELSFHTLILDEAQTFKNHATQTAQAVKSIQARYRFALTGTPIENRLEELWSIFSVVFPALFQDRKTFGNLTKKEVSKRARPFMLRRWKRDVLQDLPDKLESVKLSELSSEQKKLYVAYLAKLQEDTLKHLSEEGYHKSRIKILAGLTRLRQICCHPALFIEGYKGSSGKLEQLKEIVEEGLANRKRLLIFSQFTQMLRLIGKELREEGVPYFYLDGSTPARERIELCNRFNDGEMDVFLISLKAGGTGLNLTGADTVVLYDLWWNPAVELQAADRAHRIGQKNVVQVIRLITQDTMEETMYELQHKKKHLIDEVLGTGQEETAVLTEQEIREMLKL